MKSKLLTCKLSFIVDQVIYNVLKYPEYLFLDLNEKINLVLTLFSNARCHVICLFPCAKSTVLVFIFPFIVLFLLLHIN